MSALTLVRILFLFGAIALPLAADAVVINNDTPAGTVGHWAVDVLTGGESVNATLTANRVASADVTTTDILFDYLSYVDPGNDGGGFRLAGSAPVLDAGNADSASSAGTFIGANGNEIAWTAVSSIANGSPTMTSLFTFTATTGTLGVLRFLQYMDEDIEGSSDDVFFTRGSIASNDLELFTVDNAEVYGVSHSGALSSAAGLADADFAGWAADVYNLVNGRIVGAGQNVSQAGVIANLPSINHPEVGPAYGPRDIVSVLAWDVDPTATTATIVTTLGGVPDVSAVQCGNGNVEDGEECDDGNSVPSDGCTNACTTCGNEVVTAPEECDDGGTVSGDGCSASCETEAVCGNESVEPGEECDDGNTDNGDGCSSLCQNELGCGNGELEGDEQCDDGNTVSGDGCSASCETEAVCGNETVEPGEECDDGNIVSGDGCSAECTIEDRCVLACASPAAIHGTAGRDVMVGTPADEIFCGEGGNDYIIGGGGEDTICGGPGNDLLRGGQQSDYLDGGEDNDRLNGMGGSDVVRGGSGRDTVRGGEGADIVEGGGDDDRLYGVGGNDQLDGGPGDDRLNGGQDTDTCINGETNTRCE